jgi:hypothetical protein
MSGEAQTKKVPWFLWPFWMVWRLVVWIVGLTGRLLAVILGFVFLVAGLLLSFTLVGLIIGVPMIVLGGLMIIRGLF